MQFLRNSFRAWQDARQLKRTPIDERTLVFHRDLIKAGDLCFDIGANTGSRTRIFRHLGARVVAVEPQRSCLQVLRIAHFLDRAVTIVPAACGAQSGTATMMLCDSSLMSTLSADWMRYLSNMRRFEAVRWEGTQPCRVTTLDALIRSFGVPDFIKIDVEGYEPEVIQGLSHPVRSLSFEFAAGQMESTSRSIGLLLDLGFSEFNVSIEESFTFLLHNWMDASSILKVIERVIAKLNPHVLGDLYARHHLSSSSCTAASPE